MFADWIAVHWGSSRLHAWAMDADNRVLGEAGSDAGTSHLDPDQFEPALLDLVLDWLDLTRTTDVFVCGMAGARQGWAESSYATVPGPPRGPQPLAKPKVRDASINVYILPGMRQDSPTDVMRGEETQMLGLVTREPRFDGIVCLPGTHSKWILMSAGEVVSFATFMTGELFALLAGASVLRYTVGDDGWSEEHFVAAVEEAISFPELIARKLFGIRAEALLNDLGPAESRSRLSGLLIGAELAGARPYWLGRDMVLVGDDRLVSVYERALGICGVKPRRHDATELTLAGLAAARAEVLATR